jgi:hypothetical protein
MKRFVVAVAVALAALALAAPASATTVIITITCDEATFAYSSFPEGLTSTSVESVTVDGTTVYSAPFEFVGPTDSHTVPLSIVGNATVVATSAWTTPFNQGSVSSPPTPVECGGGTTDGTTDGTTEGTTDGTTEGTTDGTTEGTTDGTTEGTDGTTNGTTDDDTGGVDVSTTGGTEPGGELPFTGLPIWIPILLAGALLASGAFLLRRKRDAS